MPDDHPNLFAAIEIRWRLRIRAKGYRDKQKRRDGCGK